jgi:broad specificity phosphatase PhoE
MIRKTIKQISIFKLFFGLCVGLLLPNVLQAKPCKVVFVRHGETKYNFSSWAKSDMGKKTKTHYGEGFSSPEFFKQKGWQSLKSQYKEDQIRSGVEQVEDLTNALMSLQNKGFQFDKIVVSPMLRARQTIAPFLIQSKQQASVWPEIREQGRGVAYTDYESEYYSSSNMPYANELFKYMGMKTQSKSSLSNHFVSDYSRKLGDQYHESKSAAERIKKFCKEKGGNLLLVGHSMQGARLIRELTGQSVRLVNSNASVMEYTPNDKHAFNLKNNRTKNQSSDGQNRSHQYNVKIFNSLVPSVASVVDESTDDLNHHNFPI